MDKKLLIGIGILIIAVILLGGCIRKPKPTPTTTTTMLEECGNGMCGTGENKDSCPEDCETTKLSDIKVAMLYESIIDNTRDRDKVVPIIEEINPDYIHRSFFRWRGLAKIERETDVYGILKTQIEAIKEKKPNIIIGGALAAQEINAVEYDPFTGEVIPEEKTWEMALDPEKYGFSMTKEELHEKYWEATGSKEYVLPDITNPDYQKLLLDYAKKQIDSGVDAIWIDGFFVQAKIFAGLNNKKLDHPSIKEVFEANDKIIDEIHRYGKTKGKYIYVGSWAAGEYVYMISTPPKLDFVTISPSPEEVKNKKLDEDKQKKHIEQIRKKYGDVPIIAFIDWAFTTDTALGIFSQSLNKEEQKEALKNFDKFFIENGVIFAYPVHGGYTGRGASKLAFSKYTKYDALAPEFDTYETIKELALNKTGDDNG